MKKELKRFDKGLISEMRQYIIHHSFYLLQLKTILEQLKCFVHLLMDEVYVKVHSS